MNKHDRAYLLRRFKRMGIMTAKGYKVWGDYMYKRFENSIGILNYMTDVFTVVEFDDLDSKLIDLFEEFEDSENSENKEEK